MKHDFRKSYLGLYKLINICQKIFKKNIFIEVNKRSLKPQLLLFKIKTLNSIFSLKRRWVLLILAAPKPATATSSSSKATSFDDESYLCRTYVLYHL